VIVLAWVHQYAETGTKASLIIVCLYLLVNLIIGLTVGMWLCLYNKLTSAGVEVGGNANKCISAA